MGSYSPPVITNAGLSIPTFQQIISYYIANYLQFFGQNSSTDDSNADIQLINILALALYDTNLALQSCYSNQAPSSAIGAALAVLVSVNGLQKKVATASTVGVTLTGTAGATVTNGQVVDSVYGYTWNLPALVTIGGGGTVTVTATCTVLGAVNVGPGTVTGIGTPTAGWTSVTNSAASVPGLPIEQDSQLRTRQAQSVALPSQTQVASLYAALLAIPGVTAVYVDNNTTSTTNGNSTPGHSIQTVVQAASSSGMTLAVATAILLNLNDGCGVYGTTSQSVTDPNTGISYTIEFDYATEVPIYVVVNAHPVAGGTLTTAQVTAIQNAVAAYINTLTIGETVSFGEIVTAAAAALNTNPSQPVVSIRSPLYLGTSFGGTSSADLAMAFNQIAQGLTGVDGSSHLYITVTSV
jgi:uncharacterized phage protein gp47/JayE